MSHKPKQGSTSKARERPPVASAADRLGQMRTENQLQGGGRGVALASEEWRPQKSHWSRMKKGQNYNPPGRSTEK